jgi:hypothetical protein
MMDQFMEHRTGLIFPSSAPQEKKSIPLNGKTLSPQIVKALQSLRDANPSLERKLNHGIVIDPKADEHLAYWNRTQEIVSVEGEVLKGIHLGGLMVRIVDCVPFFQCLNDENMIPQSINFGGTDVSTKNLLQGLQKIQTTSNESSFLKELYLGGCGIASRKGVQDLLQVLQLPLCSNITKLDLRYNDLSGDDMATLEPILSVDHSKIEIIHLEGNTLKCNGAKAIGSIFANTKSLKEMYLGANSIGVDGAKHLAEGLRNNLTVEKLYLDGNFIGNDGADAFREVLLDQTGRKCKVLKHLYVENNGMDKDAAMKLGRALNPENLIDGSLFD